jgi:hypothetical protein
VPPKVFSRYFLNGDSNFDGGCMEIIKNLEEKNKIVENDEKKEGKEH